MPPRFEERLLPVKALRRFVVWEGCASTKLMRAWFAIDNANLKITLAELYAEGLVTPVCKASSPMWTVLSGGWGYPSPTKARAAAMSARTDDAFKVLTRQAIAYAKIDNLPRRAPRDGHVLINGDNIDLKKFPGERGIFIHDARR